MPTLMWFRSDLRVRDNRALHAACSASRDGVVGVFLVSPAQWGDHDWGAPKVGFVLRSLRALGRELAALNIPLRVVTVPRFAGASGALLGVAREVGADRLCFNREYEVNERARDDGVCDAFEKAGVAVAAFHDQTIVPVHDIRTGTGKFYTVFTPFLRAWEGVAEDGDLWAPLPAPAKQPRVPVEADEVPDSVEGFGEAAIDWDLWPAGEAAAGERLDAFVRSKVDEYGERRDFAAADATSTLSPYLAAGVISARTCVYAAAARNKGRIATGNAGVVKWVQELVWRDFYRHVLIGYPRVCRGRAFKVEVDESVGWSYDERAFEAWREGRTGYPMVDAGMRQLARTGWMHNRLRMIVAMFLTKDLLIDWRLGERH
ncbi:MAG: deoxyribodipyrimidine photo-lyase, partial [Phycisphaerales bacterium]